MLENTFSSRNYYFQKPVRALFSGSSQSGKSFLIGELLKNQERIYGESWSYICYFYPRLLDSSPVDYETKTNVPLSYFAGFPEKTFLDSLPENSLIIIDDQSSELVKSELIATLFKETIEK